MIHLRAPVRHLAPGQQVAEERLRHEAEVDEHPEDPDELPRSLVRAVEQGPEHVQVDDDEERGGAGGVHVADEPPPFDVAHDVLDGLEGERRIRLVEHREPDAGDDLQHQHQQGQRAEEVPEVEVLRRVVVREVLVPQLREREPGVRPFEQAGQQSHHAAPSSSPMTIRVSLRYMCGGTSRFVGGRHPLVDPARVVEARAVAGAEEPALPVGAEVALALPHVGRRTAEVGAEPDQHEHFRLDGAVGVARVLGLLRLVGCRVAHHRVEYGQRIERFLRAPDDPHRLAAPFHGEPGAGFQLADVDLHRRPDRPCALARLPCGGERPGGAGRPGPPRPRSPPR